MDKLSKAEVQEIMRKEILPLEIQATDKYADYNRLYNNTDMDTNISSTNYRNPETY